MYKYFISLCFGEVYREYKGKNYVLMWYSKDFEFINLETYNKSNFLKENKDIFEGLLKADDRFIINNLYGIKLILENLEI